MMKSIFLRVKSNFNAFTIIARNNVTTKTEFAVLRNVGRSEEGKRFGESKILKIILLGIPTISFGLGTWQIQRFQWKSNLLEELKQRTSQDPIELPLDLEEIKSKEYYPVKVKGRFLNEKEVFIGPRSLMVNNAQGGPRGVISTRPNTGYYVITPFKLENQDTTILVNRGWVPQRLRSSSARRSSQIDDTTEIQGLIRLDEKGMFFAPGNSHCRGTWMRRDIDSIAEHTGADPIFIDLISKHDLPDAPISKQTNLKLRNEHLSYIFTWYTLSGLTGWMWYRQYLQKLPRI